MVSESPKVCCVVLTWNDRANVLACLESLSHVVYPNLEILVSDNGSTDGTIEAIREQYPQCHLLENGENLYWAGGNNVGLKYGPSLEVGYRVSSLNISVPRRSAIDMDMGNGSPYRAGRSLFKSHKVDGANLKRSSAIDLQPLNGLSKLPSDC